VVIVISNDYGKKNATAQKDASMFRSKRANSMVSKLFGGLQK
jgi:hypothetical protein